MRTTSRTGRRSTPAHAWEEEWREAAETERVEAARARPTARSRLLLLLPPAVVAATAPMILWVDARLLHRTEAAIIASAVVALIAVSVVPLANRLGVALPESGSGDRLLFIAALASAGAAAVHFSVIKMHFDEYTLYGVFFVGSAVAQLVWPIWLLLRRWAPLLVLGAIGNAAIVALWAIDRVGWTPIGPDATKPPPFGLGDSITSGFEVLLVVACIVALARGRGRPLRWRANLTLTLGTAAR